jgi:hypothetical protein
MKKKDTSMDKAFGDVPGYLVFLITYLSALLGVTFLGGGFLIFQPNENTPRECNAQYDSEDSLYKFINWSSWVSNVFSISMSDRFYVTNKLYQLIQFLPDLVVFYGMAIFVMFIIPIILYPLSVFLVIKSAFAICPNFKDSIKYVIPFLFLSEVFDMKTVVDPNTLSDNAFVMVAQYIGGVITYILKFCCFAMMTLLFGIMNFIILIVASSFNSFLVIYQIFSAPFRDISQVFKKMGDFTTSLSLITLAIVLWGAKTYLSIYVFIGFCFATVAILFREALTELLKPDKQ